MQYGEAVGNDMMKPKLFAYSLRGGTFTWYANLSENSVHTWREMDQKFHGQFYRIEPKVSMADQSNSV